MSDQQVNSVTPRYPVDRYLVECSNKLEMVNITDEDIWNVEPPALRPEDEILLRKLHDMLQSTADDLKLLSGELSKYHEPGVQVKSKPTPLDEHFNEKVHIEELVNAKFHGYKIVNKSQHTCVMTQGDVVNELPRTKSSDSLPPKKNVDAGIQVSQMPIFRKSAKINNLKVSRTKTVQINENFNDKVRTFEVINSHRKEKTSKPAVAYKELTFKYSDPKVKVLPKKPLQVQNMPCINIRSELREQKVLQLSIEPKAMNNDQNEMNKNNIGVILLRHESVLVPKIIPTTSFDEVPSPIISTAAYSKEPIRKYSKMSSCESIELDSHNTANSVNRGFHKIRPYRATKTAFKLPGRHHTESVKNKRNIISKKESTKTANPCLEIWKHKLNAVYGCPTSSRKTYLVRPENKSTKTGVKPSLHFNNQPIKNRNKLNNAEYIPYSKFTLGGARVSDIEKELSGIPNKNEITLGPILNKILSRENSFHNESPRVDASEESPKILTTSDENLLQEILDIEKKVSNTFMKNVNEHNAPFNTERLTDRLNDVDDEDSYADDFEDDKSDYSAQSEKQNQLSGDLKSNEINLEKSHNTDSENRYVKTDSRKDNIHNKTYTKTPNLSLKKNVDVFEFLHNIDTQDTGTQSITTQKISLKETQTSPRNDKCNVQPIHNDLWPPLDPSRQVEKLFQLEKDFIKKLIIDEYGDVLEKNIHKPSTSKGNQSSNEKNKTAAQKNTQTSPSQVKNVMTSPTETKTKTTSPFALSLTVERQTSPIKEEVQINVENGNELDLFLNLSSPRFSLRLPQTSCEVISSLESHAASNRNTCKDYSSGIKLSRKNVISSSSSADGDYSSSDISSVGEIRFKLKRFRKLQVPALSELSSSTSHSKYGSDFSEGIIPLRSEGEVSSGQVHKKKLSKNIKSEGEASVGRI